MMAETESEKGYETPTAEELPGVFRKFLRKHWGMLVLFVLAAVLASISAIFVYLWVVESAQATGLVPTSLGQWTMGYAVTFILHLIFWEALLIGVPMIIAAGATYQLWWKELPDEEKKEYAPGTRTRAESGGGGISFLVFIAFCIKVFLDGNWNVAFATWTFDYLVYSMLTALIWVLIIFGIPIGLGIIWWMRREMKKEP